jgi:hypothetical protein
MSQIHAYCWRTGRIDFGQKTPRTAIGICKGEEQAVRDLMTATARHAYDGKTLLVPGVPEADDGDAAVDALIRWCDWLKSCRRPEGVTF